MKQVKKEALPDRGAERELKTIIIVCYSCTWNGFYSDYLVIFLTKYEILLR